MSTTRAPAPLLAALVLLSMCPSACRPTDAPNTEPTDAGSPPETSTVSLTLLVTAPGDTPSGAVVHVAGNRIGPEPWSPSSTPLNVRADGRLEHTLTLARGAALEFKFTLGSWETVEKSANGGERANRTHRADLDATLEIVIERWARPAGACVPTLAGDVRKLLHLGSGEGGGIARDVLVQLPDGYATEPDRRYPVLYLHDGQNMFDACTAFGGVEWRADETTQALTQAGRVSPLIVVALENTASRLDEYTPVPDREHGGGGAEAYARVVATVKQVVDATYRTRSDAASTGVLGSSLGGLVSLHLGLTRPGTYTRIGALSPSVWWSDRELVSRIGTQTTMPPLRIHADMGTQEGDGDAINDARALRDALLSLGFVAGSDLSYVEVPGGRHHESAWAARFGDVLAFLYPP